MATGYGYQNAQGANYYKPPKPKVSPLAQAASGGASSASNPFGLNYVNGGFNMPNFNQAQPHPAAQAAAAPAVAPMQPSVTVAAQHPTNTAPVAQNAYDINTDPALQQVNALTGMNDQQATASALKQKQDQLLAYGDQNLSQAVLGDSSMAQAAGQNPTSTLHQLGTQRDRNLTNLTEQLNQANLGYSGYRVTQEQQAGQDYQNQLAQAASGINSTLGGIDSSLSGVLAGNQAQRVQAMQAAEAAHAQDAGAQPFDLAGLLAGLGLGGGGGDPNAATPADPNQGSLGGSFGGGQGGTFLDANAPNVDQLALMLGRGRRPVGY